MKVSSRPIPAFGLWFYASLNRTVVTCCCRLLAACYSMLWMSDNKVEAATCLIRHSYSATHLLVYLRGAIFGITRRKITPVPPSQLTKCPYYVRQRTDKTLGSGTILNRIWNQLHIRKHASCGKGAICRQRNGHSEVMWNWLSSKSWQLLLIHMLLFKCCRSYFEHD